MLKNILFKKYFKPHEYCECSTLSLSAILLFQQCGSYFSNVLFMEPCTFFKMRKWIQILYCKEVVPDLKKNIKDSAVLWFSFVFPHELNYLRVTQ